MSNQAGTPGHETPRVNDYDAFAQAYATENEHNLVNAFYERPAMLALAGDVAGRRILDAGCGAGLLTEALLDRGAAVTGLDSSAGMLALARARLGERSPLVVGDLAAPLPFADAAFDDVIASLVLHYLRDWVPTLTELRRVLRPGGRLLVSVDHPAVAYAMSRPRPDYFATTSYSFEWAFGGHTAAMTFWRRPLQGMLDAFADAGFRLRTLAEPQPDPAGRDRFGDDFRELSTRMCFMFFVLDVPEPS